MQARFWVKELQKHANPGIIIALVGNKSDMSAAREVPFEVRPSPTLRVGGRRLRINAHEGHTHKPVGRG